MSDPSEALELIGAIDSQRAVLHDLFTFFDDVIENDLKRDGHDRKAGLVVAGLLENYYTCAETVLFRIVQSFGNHVDPSRWHADVLERLTMEVPTIRPRVLSSHAFDRLDELRRFRHFKRYYYRTDFDPDKLLFLATKLRELHPVLIEDLNRFRDFLSSIA